MLLGTACPRLLVWAASNRAAIRDALHGLGLRTAVRLADAVANHQPQAVEQGLELLLDATRQAELQTVERVTAAERERRERARLWERELCLSALVLHGSPAACLGTDRQTAKTVEPLLLDRSGKAARALLIGLAADGTSMRELAGLRARLVATLRRRVDFGPKTVATHQGWGHRDGAVHHWPAANPPAVEPEQLAFPWGGDRTRTVEPPTTGPCKDPRQLLLPCCVPGGPEAPDCRDLDIEALLFGPNLQAVWREQYPEMFRDTYCVAPEQPLGLWHRYSPQSLAFNPLLPNFKAPRTVALAPRQGWVHREQPQIQDWNGTALAVAQYLDSLMDGPGLLAHMASEWALELGAASRRGWDKFDARQILWGALHFVTLECRRLRRWGTESDESKLAAVGCVSGEYRLLAGLPKTRRAQPCRRKKCRRMADYTINRNPYCRTHALEIQGRKEQ